MGSRVAREFEKKKLTDFTAEFLGKHVSEDEIAMVRRLVTNAVEDGKFDQQRRLNWPDSLQDKAREFYERYEKIGKPSGY